MPEQKRIGTITEQPKEPSNQRLWDLLVVQAKHKFSTYPSLAASHWVHETYIKQGGRFVASKKHVEEKQKRDPEQSKEKGTPQVHRKAKSKEAKEKMHAALMGKKNISRRGGKRAAANKPSRNKA